MATILSTLLFSFSLYGTQSCLCNNWNPAPHCLHATIATAAATSTTIITAAAASITPQSSFLSWWQACEGSSSQMGWEITWHRTWCPDSHNTPISLCAITYAVVGVRRCDDRYRLSGSAGNPGPKQTGGRKWPAAATYTEGCMMGRRRHMQWCLAKAPIHPPIHASMHASIRLSIHLFTHACIHPSTHASHSSIAYTASMPRSAERRNCNCAF